MGASRTARERARTELTAAIKDEARSQLAEVGAGGLSLRAVARALGMVSSALYRYFPSRDDLLTALIVDAYDALGEATERAVSTEETAATQWRAGCHAVRTWALAHPHEYALIYGSPVPGYQAPQDTVNPASRVAIALLGAVRTAWETGPQPAGAQPPSSEVLSAQLGDLAATVAPDLPEDVLARTLIAWTQLFGMVSFELFGQFVGSVDPSDEFFEHAAREMAGFIGLDYVRQGAR